MRKIIKTVSVAQFVDEYNKTHEDKIYRHKVYDMIKRGELKATRGDNNAWLIRIEIEQATRYTSAEFVEKYNKYHKKDPITIKKVRELAVAGKIKAMKIDRKWIIEESPRKKIKF